MIDPEWYVPLRFAIHRVLGAKYAEHRLTCLDLKFFVDERGVPKIRIRWDFDGLKSAWEMTHEAALKSIDLDGYDTFAEYVASRLVQWAEANQAREATKGS